MDILEDERLGSVRSEPRKFGRIGGAVRGPPIPEELQVSKQRLGVQGSPLMSRRDRFFADIQKPNRVFPLNMRGVNPLVMNPKALDKADDIERTLKVSHVEAMPTPTTNYYQDLIRKFAKAKRRQKPSATVVSPPEVEASIDQRKEVKFNLIKIERPSVRRKRVEREEEGL